MSANPWKPTDRQHISSNLLEPINNSSAWTREELEVSRSYLYLLSAAEISEIFGIVERIERDSPNLHEVTQEDFNLPIFGSVLEDLRREVINGRGFVFLRGLPTEGRSLYQTALAFWGLGCHFGRAVSQNGKGHLLGHVKDLGEKITSPTGRGYNSASQLGFHADSCDIFSLCALKTSKSGGQHRMCSSVTVHNKMLERSPELVEELAFRFYRSRRGELPAGEAEPWTRQPVFSVTDGYFSARGASSTIMRSQGMPGVPELTDGQREAIKVYNEIASEMAMDVSFEPGDISIVQNYVNLHSRTRYEDWPEEDRKRHLLRLWLSFEGARPLHEDILRDHAQGIQEKGTVLHAPLVAA